MATSLPYGKQRRSGDCQSPGYRAASCLLLDEPAAGMNPQETDDLSCFYLRKSVMNLV